MGIEAVVAVVAEASAGVAETGAALSEVVGAAAAGVTASAAVMPEVAAAAAEWGGSEIAGDLGSSFLGDAATGAALDAAGGAATSGLVNGVVDDFAVNGMGSQLATDAPAAAGKSFGDMALSKAGDMAINTAASQGAQGLLAPDTPTPAPGTTSDPNAFDSFKPGASAASTFGAPTAPAVPPAFSQQFDSASQAAANGTPIPAFSTSGIINQAAGIPSSDGKITAPDGASMNPMQGWGSPSAQENQFGGGKNWLDNLTTDAKEYLTSPGGSRVATGIVGGVIQGVGQGMAANQKHQWELDALARAKQNLSAPVVIAGPRQ